MHVASLIRTPIEARRRLGYRNDMETTRDDSDFLSILPIASVTTAIRNASDMLDRDCILDFGDELAHLSRWARALGAACIVGVMNSPSPRR